MVCKGCGYELHVENKFCAKCGMEVIGSSYQVDSISVSRTGRAYQSDDFAFVGNISIYLSEYYKNEFSKIRNSNEDYTGRWNWSAFIFGIWWALSKGLWLSFVVAVVLSLFTYGVGGLVYSFVLGMRGNYMLYKLYLNGKQTIY